MSIILAIACCATVSAAKTAILPELPVAGLHGYINAEIAPAPANYGYGVSFYTQVWPLILKPLASFQIGLPSTWLLPNNRDDNNDPLCPVGTLARDRWPERGPTYRSVFQTIEGSLGYWTNIQFNSVVPKYNLIGTPDCYTTQIASYNWRAGTTSVLPTNLMGIAQLSNRIILPPEGMTFSAQKNRGLMGFAWMALPITFNKTNPAPTGDQSWTLFVNTANFAGPIAFFIPNNWSRLSQTYPYISGRGLDTREAIANGGAMEVNSVPYFKAKDKTGTVYTRIPRIQFPVDGNGNTALMQDIYYYSKQAIYLPLKNALANNKDIPLQFDSSSSGARTPDCKANPLQFTQENQILLTGFDKDVQTFSSNEGGKCLFGLKWKGVRNGFGVFPNYFKQAGGSRMAIPVNDVPKETQLVAQNFKTTAIGNRSYQVPMNDPTWSHTASARAFRVKLTDGSTIEYHWYRFVDQPSLQHLNLTAAQKNALQSLVVKLHQSWSTNSSFMPAANGAMVEIDRALLVTPPAGLEYGYVPIVTLQR